MGLVFWILASFSCAQEADASSLRPFHFVKTGNGSKDCITPSVCITRGGSGPIYNSVLENTSGGLGGPSPSGTEWAFGLCTSKSSLTFKTFMETCNKSTPSIVNKSMCIHLIQDDLYVDVMFDSWGRINVSGGFSYYRSIPNKAPSTTIAAGYIASNTISIGSPLLLIAVAVVLILLFRRKKK